MSVAQASAMRPMSHPGFGGLVAEAVAGQGRAHDVEGVGASPPCAAGSASGPMTSRNSTTDPGQPWVMTSGNASGDGDCTWMKWTPRPSSSVRNCGSPFSCASHRRQS